MIDCKETLARFYEYLDLELPELQAEEVAEHLKACRACFERMEFEKQFGAFLRAEGTLRVEATELRDRIKARLQELEDVAADRTDVLFPDHVDHAPIDDVPLPPPRPAGTSPAHKRRIPAWSYLLAAAALVLVSLPLLRPAGEKPVSLPRALAVMHTAGRPQMVDADAGVLAGWLAQRVPFDPMVQEFVAAGCAIQGAAVDSVWAHIFAEADGTPISVFVAPVSETDVERGFEPVQVGPYRFWTAQEGDVAVVIWHWHPTGVVCAVAARMQTMQLVELVYRLEESLQGA